MTDIPKYSAKIAFDDLRSSMKLLITVLLYTLATTGADVLERATKISFPSEVNGDPLLGVGVRRKGPIKVYAVGAYSSSIAERLSGEGLARKAIKTLLSGGLRDDAKTTSFLLKMNLKVGGEKIASAICDSVGSRCAKKDPAALSSLSSLITAGLEDQPALKGTTLCFCCEESEVRVNVNGKDIGKVGGIAGAFRNVYFDDKSVSDSLKESICDKFAVEE